MDANTFARMARGRLRPEARLDLHGMTLAEAHGEVVRFVLHARARGLRLVLLITGKGRGDEVGALRRDVPRWLALPPLAPAVLQVAPAHRSHGGEGALYVYLRA
jgi:DNA-nicking Smr family endonuclease